MLAETYTRHAGALRASIRAEYHATPRDFGVLELADLVAWLPPGCALWRSVGGPLAWSEETHLLNLVEHRLRVLAWLKTKDAKAGKNRPKPLDAPKYAGDKSRVADEMERKAAAHRRRNQPT